MFVALTVLYSHLLSYIHEWGKECCVEKCTRKERMGIIWWKAGIWKPRGIRKGFERGNAPYAWGRRMLNI
jgi:hypothetical protein